ncbi:hypothetical protein AB834_05055 [PVC group bacterium (ex Bugula neritina AB1)]|nr:hypothetical protein AB834_05055 [PVC group bacterium (ex Bugula neritina AB1)]
MDDFDKAVEELNLIGEQSIKPGLERIQTAFDQMNLRNHFETVHVHIAGTNGKGSTAHYLYQMLRSKGQKVGLYTSPHLDSIIERIRIGDKEEQIYISPETFVKYFRFFKNVENLKNIKLSYFEIVTAIAIKWFDEQKIDTCIWEVGLGGRLDATNVICSSYAVITNIGLDHQEYLGETKKDILHEKAGILKKDQKVVSMLEAKLRPELDKIAKKKDIKVQYIDLPPTASFDTNNKILAKSVFENMGFSIGLNDCQSFSPLQGRMEWLMSNVCVDAAHNVDGMKALAIEMKKMKGDVSLVLGILERKSYKPMIEAIAPFVSEVCLVRGFSEDQHSVRKLEDECLKYLSKVSIMDMKNLRHYLSIQKKYNFVAGSLVLISKVRRLMK